MSPNGWPDDGFHRVDCKRCKGTGKLKVRQVKKKVVGHRATLEFITKAERDMWMRWYYDSGCRHFSLHMMQYGKNWWKTKSGLHWRKVADARMDNWPHNNEKFVND